MAALHLFSERGAGLPALSTAASLWPENALAHNTQQHPAIPREGNLGASVVVEKGYHVRVHRFLQNRD